MKNLIRVFIFVTVGLIVILFGAYFMQTLADSLGLTKNTQLWLGGFGWGIITGFWIKRIKL